MSAGFALKGLDEFAAELTKLPAAVRAAIKPVVVAKAHALEGRIASEYQSRGAAGAGEGMRVDVDDQADSLGARVVNPSKVGHLYEQGTAARYDDAGHYRGRMPAAHVMARNAERARRELVPELEKALERVGQ